MVESQAANTRGQYFAAAVLLGWALSAAQPAAGQEPIDGVCDDSVRNGCAAGTANDEAFPDQPNAYLWRCDGLNGGRNSDKCFLPMRVDGVCDDSVRNGCAAGTANDEAFPDQPNAYLWRCDGLHGGRNSDKCFLPMRVDGVCDESVRNGCAAGTANDEAFPDQPNAYLWRCDGLNGGTNSSKCSKFVPVDGVCDETRRNGCAAGTANDAVFPNYPTVYVWRCDGQFGGANSEKCSKFTAVDGGWSDWSACSATACGTAGTQTRTCSDPVPAHDGRQCLKLDGTRGASETRGCTGAAAVDGGWSAWSACSASACGAAGTQTRTCDNPAPGCGGSSCSGPSSRACTGGDARDGVWETGAWGSWSACSGSICNRSRSRSVTCAPGACGGAACDESSRPAATQTSACPSPAWQTGAWGAWSACSATACDAAGQQTRTRTVSCPCGTACAGTEPTSTETRSCTGSNPRDGVWETGAWGPWSACSGSICNRSRSRSVTCALRACGGAACDASNKPAATQTSACPSPAWQTGAWSEWSDCSVTACGVTGQQTRTRTVSCPCGTACAGTKPASSETRSCLGNDPRDGVWQPDPWGPWDPCDSSTCEQERTRLVPCSPPGCGGAPCNENNKPPLTETQSCSNPPNPAWRKGPWGEWTDCSATACGVPGHQIRTRTVSCPCGSRACPPLDKPAERETQSCTGSCILCLGQTLQWGSGCSATATTTLSRASVNLTNAASCRGGSATFTCNAPDWSGPTNATCTVTPAVNGRCGTTTDCVAGTRANVTETTSLLRWSCVGSCDGTTAQCHGIKSLSVSISVSSGSATATVSGGTAPYTYTWEVLGASMEGSSSGGASITFSSPGRALPTAVSVSVEVRDSAGLIGWASSTSAGRPGP